MIQQLKKHSLFKRGSALYVKVTGVVGILFVAGWTIGTIGHTSNSITDVFLYTGWLLLAALPYYLQAIIFLFLLYLLIPWQVAAYQDTYKAYILLKSSENFNTKSLFLFVRKYTWKYIYEFFLYAMSLFVTAHIIFIILSFVHAL